MILPFKGSWELKRMFIVVIQIILHDFISGTFFSRCVNLHKHGKTQHVKKDAHKEDNKYEWVYSTLWSY